MQSRACRPVEIFLKTGEMFLTREPAVLKTILGSCIGISFRCPRVGAGALCHAVLPRCPAWPAGDSRENGFRYVDFCVRTIARRFDQLGARRDEVEVKVFGGANLLFMGELGGTLAIGRQNAEVAMQVLREERLIVRTVEIGGHCGRRIRFDVGTGEVEMSLLAERLRP